MSPDQPARPMELGVLSLSDLQADPATGALRDAAARTREIVSSWPPSPRPPPRSG
jgi:hypothetical protein